MKKAYGNFGIALTEQVSTLLEVQEGLKETFTGQITENFPNLQIYTVTQIGKSEVTREIHLNQLYSMIKPSKIKDKGFPKQQEKGNR